jgi:uncharacterized membrane protein
MTDTTRARVSFARQDVAEIAMGACVMAFPVTVTQEVWDLGQELSLMRVALFAVASVFFLALLIYLLQLGRVPADPKVFLQRVLSTYGLTLVISALLLIGVDRLELMHPLVGLKRTILVAFPASFAATVVDGLGISNSD